MINIRPTPPPNWTQIQLYQNSHQYNPPKGSVFSYGKFIYNPDNAYIDVPTYVHESLHLEQQKKLGSSKWWDKFLKDKRFRLEQELPAYQVQYHAVREFVKDEKRLKTILGSFANEIVLLFKGLITKEQALKAIQSEKLVSVRVSKPDKEVPELLSDFRFKQDVEFEAGA